MILNRILPITCICITSLLHAASFHTQVRDSDLEEDIWNTKKTPLSIAQVHTDVPGKERYYAVDTNLLDYIATKCDVKGRIISGPNQNIVEAVRMQLGGSGRFNDLTLETAIANILAKDSSLAEQTQSVYLATGSLERRCHIILPAELQHLIKDLPACDHQAKRCKEHDLAIWKMITESAEKAPIKHFASILMMVVARREERCI